MNKRLQNERTFSHWEELPNGGRRYWHEITSRRGWKARYVKVVDAQEITESFHQEIYDSDNVLREVHHKYPVDNGHQKIT